MKFSSLVTNIFDLRNAICTSFDENMWEGVNETEIVALTNRLITFKNIHFQIGKSKIIGSCVYVSVRTSNSLNNAYERNKEREKDRESITLSFISSFISSIKHFTKYYITINHRVRDIKTFTFEFHSQCFRNRIDISDILKIA